MANITTRQAIMKVIRDIRKEVIDEVNQETAADKKLRIIDQDDRSYIDYIYGKIDRKIAESELLYAIFDDVVDDLPAPIDLNEIE